MIPLGTGLFRTLYDPIKHNYNRHKEYKFKENANIVEDKIRQSIVGKNKKDLSDILNFNLFDTIR